MNKPYPINVTKLIIMEKTGEISHYITQLNVLNEFFYSLDTINGNIEFSLEKLKYTLNQQEKINTLNPSKKDELSLVSPYENNFVLISFKDYTIHTINKMPYIGLINFSLKDFAIKLRNLNDERIHWEKLINQNLLSIKNLKESNLTQEPILDYFQTNNIEVLIDKMSQMHSYDIYPRNFKFKISIYYPNNHASLIEYILNENILIDKKSQDRWLELEKRFQPDKLRKETLFEKHNLEQQIKNSLEKNQKFKL